MSRTTWTRKARNRLLPILMALTIVFGTATAITVVSATPAHATNYDSNTYPWGDATCVTPNPKLTPPACAGSVTYDNWGYSTCPSNDTGCMGLSGVLNGTTYGEKDPWGEYLRNCTSYVAWMLHSVNGFEMPFYDDGVNWGTDATSRGYVVNSTPAVGSVFWDSANDHVGWVYAVSADGSTATYEDFNSDYTGNWLDGHTVTASGHKFIHFKDLTSDGGSGGGTPPPSRELIINNTAGWAEDNIGNGWTQETATNDVKAVSVGGGLMMIINGCGAVYATNAITGGGWTQETGCGAAKAIAASSSGVQMYLDYCNAVNAQSGNPSMNWTPETGCGTANAIAVGSGGLQMMLDGCNAVWAKNGVGPGGWNSESGCGTASAIAAGTQNIQVIINACNAVYAQNNISTSWNQEAGCGTASAIAAGGMYQMLINACGAVYAVGNITTQWTQETPCSAATAVAVGTQGRQLYIGTNGHTYAEESSLGNYWTDETPGGGTTAVAVG